MYLCLIYISNAFAIDLRLKGACQSVSSEAMVDAEGRNEGDENNFQLFKLSIFLHLHGMPKCLSKFVCVSIFACQCEHTWISACICSSETFFSSGVFLHFFDVSNYIFQDR